MLYAKKVISIEDQKVIEGKPLHKEKITYLFNDVLKESLKFGFSDKYKRFLKILDESDDPASKELAKKLGECIYVKYASIKIICNNIK